MSTSGIDVSSSGCVWAERRQPDSAVTQDRLQAFVDGPDHGPVPEHVGPLGAVPKGVPNGNGAAGVVKRCPRERNVDEVYAHALVGSVSWVGFADADHDPDTQGRAVAPTTVVGPTAGEAAPSPDRTRTQGGSAARTPCSSWTPAWAHTTPQGSALINGRLRDAGAAAKGLTSHPT